MSITYLQCRACDALAKTELQIVFTQSKYVECIIRVSVWLVSQKVGNLEMAFQLKRKAVYCQ